MSEEVASKQQASGPKTHKIAIEVSESQYEFLRMFASQNDIPPSHVYRSLLYVMQTDMNVARRVVSEIYKEYEAYNAKMRLESLKNNASE